MNLAALSAEIATAPKGSTSGQKTIKLGELYYREAKGFGKSKWEIRFVSITVKNRAKKLEVFEKKGHYYASGKKAMVECEIASCKTNTKPHSNSAWGFTVKSTNKKDKYYFSTNLETERQSWLDFIV